MLMPITAIRIRVQLRSGNEVIDTGLDGDFIIGSGRNSFHVNRGAPPRCIDEDERPAAFGRRPAVEEKLLGESIGAANEKNYRPFAGSGIDRMGRGNLRILRNRMES